MVGSMPYSLEKGPYLAVMEDFVNGSEDRMKQVLTGLRNGDPIASNGSFNSSTLNGSPLDHDGLIDHTNRHWFGMTRRPNNQGWKPQDPWNPATNPQTGFWSEWYGDCEGILRETLVRGFEMALGLKHKENVNNSKRYWYVEAFWRCPIPWFEGWVTWREHDAAPRGGQVTLLISTPGHGTPLKNTPLRPNRQANSGYVKDPPGPGADRGMWVVSQGYHRPWPKTTTAKSGGGEWTFPTMGLGYVSEGPVVVVAPPEDEGGILDPPRQWIENP